MEKKSKLALDNKTGLFTDRDQPASRVSGKEVFEIFLVGSGPVRSGLNIAGPN